MKNYLTATITILALGGLSTAFLWTADTDPAEAHCQVPCGIYDDAARIKHLREDALTIAKAIHEINELSGKHEAQAINQATRWIMTKEKHASDIITTVSEYFLTQKVKPVAKDAKGYDAYLAKLADLHAVMVAAMKTKQNTDKAYVDSLNKAIDAMAKHYKAK
ncbi:MAG: superoxide dismutase [Ni] [Phycisphaerae bacterium]